MRAPLLGARGPPGGVEWVRAVRARVGAGISEPAKRLGGDQLATGTAIAPRYHLDAFRAHRGSRLPEAGVSPAAVAWPRSTEDVVSIVRFAAGAGLAIVPWGGGTGLMGGGRPPSDAVCFDLRAMRPGPS